MAVAIREEKKLAWGGVMPAIGAKEEDAVAIAKFCNQVAQIYGVPSLGVNAMGGKPYLNKDGRLFLLDDLRKNKVKKIQKEFVLMSKNLEEPAIVKCTIIFKDGHEVEAIGEASKQSVKLDAVKQTLNMMAETRALNRAIWLEIGGDVWRRVSKNLAAAKMSAEEKAKVAEAGNVSYEEMQQPQRRQQAKPEPSTPAQIHRMCLDSIKRTSDWGVVIEIDKKAQESAKLSDEQKKEIHDAALKRVDVLQN